MKRIACLAMCFLVFERTSLADEIDIQSGKISGVLSERDESIRVYKGHPLRSTAGGSFALATTPAAGLLGRAFESVTPSVTSHCKSPVLCRERVRSMRTVFI